MKLAKKLIKFEQDNCRPCAMLNNYLKHDLEIEPYDTKHVDDILEYGLNVQGAPILLLLDEDDSVLDYTVGFRATEVDRLVKEL